MGSSDVRVGVVILPQFLARETAARWKSLQDRGFSHGWTYDHLAWRSLADEDWYATVPTLTVAALATSTLGLGTWVASPNFRHPVTWAKDLLSLADISDGRVLAAMGAGGIGWDADVLGTPGLSPRQRVDRLTEFLTLTDLLLRQGETTWAGEYFRAERARMYPAGHRDRVPFVVAGNGPRSIRLAAGYDGWVTTGPPGADGEDWWTGLAELAERSRAAAGDRPEYRRYLNLDSWTDYRRDSLDCFSDCAGRAAALGFTDVVVHWPRRSGEFAGDERVLDRIAERLTNGVLRS